jgi:lipoprotein-releasing system permease protein
MVGTELARRWGLRPSDSIEVIAGKKGKPASLRYGGEFFTGMYDYDLHIALADLETVQQATGQQGPISAIGVRLDNALKAEEVQRQLMQRLGYPIWIVSWMDMNRNLFAALKLEKITMFVILTLIVLVASFNIVATLLMLVVSKTREIGVLKALGSTPAATRRIFFWVGMWIGLIGTAIGVWVGWGLCVALERYRFIRLPPDIYYIDHLPVKLEWNDVVWVVGAAWMISWLACLYPAWVAARLEPTRALRYE